MTQTVLISAGIGLILGLILFYIMSRFFGRGRHEGSKEVPGFSEKDAEALLRKAGYQILGKRQRETVITRINGKERFGYLEVDYTVRKDKRKYAVLVHAGEGSPDPNEPNLRRRLLECDRVFHPHALLVLDLGKGEIHEVSFYFPHERNIDFFFRFLIGLFLILMLIAIIWMLAQLQLF
jgi:ABC-type antimicrobial peptide transport system permease subunit